MPIDTGGPAYPTAQMVYKTLPHGAETIKAGEPGMTLLDHFAGLASEDDIAVFTPQNAEEFDNWEHNHGVKWSREWAKYAYARAMLAERRRLERTDATT